MYISRRNPTSRDNMIVVTRRMVAENAACWCEGRNSLSKPRKVGCGLGFEVSGFTWEDACIQADSTRKNSASRTWIVAAQVLCRDRASNPAVWYETLASPDQRSTKL